MKKPEVLNPDNLEIKYISPSKLIPYFNNPKIHSKKNIGKLMRSMTIKPGKIIFHQPISLDKDNVIIAGHGRRLAALELGLKSVPCVYPDVSEQEAIALRLADNDAFGLDYDLDKIKEELNKIAIAPEAEELIINSESIPETSLDDLPDDINELISGIGDDDEDDHEEKPDRLETQLCKKIAKDFDGEIEVKTPIGYIDIMTNTQIIEVKRVRKWKWALGQILVYGLYHPDKEKRIHLFGRCKESKLESIKEHCSKFDIVVTWQYEEFRP